MGDGFRAFNLVFLLCFLQKREWLLFRQKPPKPLAPGTLAVGYPAMLIKSGAAQLADAQTVLA